VGCLLLGVAGIGLVSSGYFFHLGKVDQISIAPPIALKDLLNEVKKDEKLHPGSKEGFYCKLEGKVATDAEPLIAPESRKKVVWYEWKKKGKFFKKDKRKLENKFDKKAVEFSITNGEISVLVEPNNASMFLETSRFPHRITESIIQIGRPLFIVGEVFHDTHGDRLIVKYPRYGKAYLISTMAESTTLLSLNFYGKLYVISGVSCLLLSLYLGAKILLDKAGHIFVPLL